MTHVTVVQPVYADSLIFFCGPNMLLKNSFPPAQHVARQNEMFFFLFYLQSLALKIATVSLQYLVNTIFLALRDMVVVEQSVFLVLIFLSFQLN